MRVADITSTAAHRTASSSLFTNPTGQRTAEQQQQQQEIRGDQVRSKSPPGPAFAFAAYWRPLWIFDRKPGRSGVAGFLVVRSSLVITPAASGWTFLRSGEHRTAIDPETCDDARPTQPTTSGGSENQRRSATCRESMPFSPLGLSFFFFLSLSLSFSLSFTSRTAEILQR